MYKLKQLTFAGLLACWLSVTVWMLNRLSTEYPLMAQLTTPGMVSWSLFAIVNLMTVSAVQRNWDWWVR